MYGDGFFMAHSVCKERGHYVVHGRCNLVAERNLYINLMFQRSKLGNISAPRKRAWWQVASFL